MAINLNKTEGSKINLTKEAPTLQNITVKLWWNASKDPSVKIPFDLDISAFMLRSTSDGPKLIADEYLVFYNNEKSPDGAVWKTKDERAGGVEELYVSIPKLTSMAEEISLVVTIDKGPERGQHFGQIEEAGLEIINSDTGEKIAFYDLDEQGTNATACQVGSFFKQDGQFSFQGVGAMFPLGLGDFVGGYSA